MPIFHAKTQGAPGHLARLCDFTIFASLRERHTTKIKEGREV